MGWQWPFRFEARERGAVIWHANGDGQSVPALTERYLALGGRGLLATETDARVFIPFACLLTGIGLRTWTAQPADAALRVQVFVNGGAVASSPLVATVPSGGGTGFYRTVTGGVGLSYADDLSLAAENLAGGPSAQLGPCWVELSMLL